MENRIEAVVVGASAGAVEALSVILPCLPQDLAVPIVCVVHLPGQHRSLLPELYGKSSKVKVKEAEDKEPLEPGTVYFAPPDYHLLIDQGPALTLSVDDPVNFSRPSIDVLFESASDVFGERMMGIVLSGANADGARGLSAICAAGGMGLVQSPDSAYCAAMPDAALRACPNAEVLTLEQIANRVVEAGGRLVG